MLFFLALLEEDVCIVDSSLLNFFSFYCSYCKHLVHLQPTYGKNTTSHGLCLSWVVNDPESNIYQGYSSRNLSKALIKEIFFFLLRSKFHMNSCFLTHLPSPAHCIMPQRHQRTEPTHQIPAINLA